MKNISFLRNSVIAHRGVYDNKTIFENSIQAFKKALEFNLPIELDIHLLKDNTLVVFHDDNLKRMINKDIKVKDCTYEQLNNYIFENKKFKVPTLLEVLNIVKGKVFLDIEIKDDGNYKKTCEELTKLLDVYKGNFIIKSFYPKYIHWFYKNRPNYIRGILLNNKQYKKYKNVLITYFDFYCKCDYYAVKQNILNDKSIQKIRNNRLIFTWTIKNDKEFNNVKDYADGVIFDFCEIKNYNTILKKLVL